MGNLLKVAATTAAMLGVAATAQARPADVVITNSTPISVAISGTPTVKVNSSAANPVSTAPVVHDFGDSATMSLNAGINSCSDLDIATGRHVEITSVIVSATGAATPTAWLRLWSETTEGGSSVAFDLDVPVHAIATPFYTWSGAISYPLAAFGGTEFDANGIGGRVQFCGKAPAGNSATIRFYASGHYLD